MTPHRMVRLAIALAMVSILPDRATLGAQELQLAENSSRGPRFLYADVPGKSKTVPVDIARTPILTQKIALNLEGVTVREALAAITQQSGISLIYGRDVIPEDARVRIRAEEITVAAALTDVLLNAGVDVVFTRSGSAALVKRPKPPAVGTIAGTVTEAKTGQPVPLAQVSVVGTSLGRTTGEDGRYSIVGVSAGTHTIVVKRLGYDPMSRDVAVTDGDLARVDFALSAATTRLAEMVTTVTGVYRRAELGNAIARIAADSVVGRAPVRDLGDLISGRAAGVQVMFGNGVAGQAPMFRIRGVNSITVSNDPIVIIDGIRVDNTPGKNLFISGRGSVSSPGRLADYNPEEIESIDVLKGPSAATLYGTDAANGVIVISTKRGHAGAPAWSAYVERGISGLHVSWPDNYYSWGHNPTTGATQQCFLLALASGACVQDSITTFNPLRAPNSPIGTGQREQYGLQVGGGAAALRYFLSGELEDETGYLRLTGSEVAFLQRERGGAVVPAWQIRPNTLDKGSTRANVVVALGNAADATVSLGYVKSRTLMPIPDVIAAGLFGRGNRDTLAQWAVFGLRRPADAFLNQLLSDVSHFTNGLALTWRPTFWLSSRANTGVDYSEEDFASTVRRGDSPSEPLGRRLQQDQTLTLYTADVGVSALFALPHSLSSRSSLGFQYNRRSDYLTGVLATGLSPGSSTVGGAATLSGFESGARSIVAGSYLEQTVGYRDELFITAAVRMDGASSFGRKFRAAAYPKTSISWVALNGRDVLGISDLRFRAGYGSSGVQPSPIAALARDTAFGSLVNGVPTNGATIIAIGNQNLKPETQREIEAGFDLDGWNRRIRFELTGYHRRSANALVDQPFAGSFGLGRLGVRQVNIGEVLNRGIEGLVNYRALDRTDLSLDIGLNGNWNRNRLVRLAPDVPRIGTRQFRQVPGYPLFGLWDRPISFADSNRNGIIELNEVRVGDTAVFFGPVLPTRQVTGTTTLGLFRDRLRLNALFDYRGGHERWNGYVNRCLTFFGNCRELNDRTAPLDRQAAAVAVNNFGFATAGFFEKADYVKFRELSIVYTSKRLEQLLRARTAVASLAARNLATFTHYSGADPEGTNAPGVDSFSDTSVLYPARYFIARLTLGY